MMLLFDKTNYGAAINISSDCLNARRTNDFGNGIVFCNRSLNIFEKVTFEIQQEPSCMWHGSLRLGLYAGNNIPTNDLPLSTMESNLSSFYTMTSLERYIHLYSGMRLTVWLTENRCLNYAINSVLRGTLIDKNEIDENNNELLPLRLVFDLFGNTIQVQFIQDGDMVPYEIKARGVDAVRHFHTACDTGTTSVRRTLLLIIGPKSSGKTCLQHMLVTNSEIDNLSSSYSINIDREHNWGLSKSNSYYSSIEIISDEGDYEKSKYVLQQHEYESQLVHNIILNLLKRRYEFHNVHDRKDKNWKNTLIEDLKLVYPSTIVPSSIRSLIEKQLTQMKSSDPHAVLSSLMNSNIHNKNNSKENLKENENEEQQQHLRLDVWDIPGSASSCGITHQIFLSSRAVYLFVFDLTKDLDQPADWNKEITNLEHLNFILHSVYCYSANINQTGIKNIESNEDRFSPPIILIGTHRNSFSNSTKKLTIENKLAKIRTMISTKPYCKHIVEPYFVIDTKNPDTIDFEQIDLLKSLIEKVTFSESYIGEQIPTRWLQFENDLNRLKRQQDSFYASLDQICDIARTQDISCSDELKTLLNFYHDLGVILYFDNTQDMFLKNTLILRPQRLIQLIKDFVCNDSLDNENDDGIIDERTFENLCQPFIDQKQSLLALLKKFDLLCERVVSANNYKQYYVPGCIRRVYNDKIIMENDEQSITFFYLFDGYFPDTLFHQILVRTIKWTQSINSVPPKLSFRRGKFVLDDQHTFVLTGSSMKYARMEVQIIRNNQITNPNITTGSAANNKNQEKINPLLPDPAIVARIRKFLETSFNDIKSTWIRRLSFQCMIVCPCGKICDLHKIPYCSNSSCLHFLNLDHCLANPIVECSFRRVATNQYRLWFPQLITTRPIPIIDILYDQKSMNHFFEDSTLPTWIRTTAKLLSTSDININLRKSTSENRTWVILAKKLGYQQSVIDQFSSSRNPSLQLVTDWIVRTGNSSLAVDMLLATIKQIGREDIADIVSCERETQCPLPPVFISYQWDIQDDVKELRNFLELIGFNCWMDMGQIGGGQILYEKIDHGIRNAKVVICCVTPMYVVSNMCQRELILADMLKKPILPVMFEVTPWPPIGPASLILSPLTYVDLKGVGGHGGSGKTADLQARYNEIATIIARHTTSSSPNTFRRLVQSSSIDQHAGANITSSAVTALNLVRERKETRDHHHTTTYHRSDSSSSSTSEDDYDDYYNEPGNSGRHSMPIEPILTAGNAASSRNQPYQIRSSVHLEHRLGSLTASHLPSNAPDRIAHCTVCNIL